MPFHTLKPMKEGQIHPEYQVVGNFQNMLYLAPDIRGDKLKQNSKTEYEQKTDAEISSEFRNQLEGLRKLSGLLIEDGTLINAWLVLTPSVCDSYHLPFKRPLKYGNFIVTDINVNLPVLIANLIVPSLGACGEAAPRPKRKQTANQASLGVYVY